MREQLSRMALRLEEVETRLAQPETYADAALLASLSREPKELTPDELDKAAGGTWWTGEDAPDGHEMGCAISWHHYTYQKENNIWCNMSYYCDGKHQEAPNWMDV